MDDLDEITNITNENEVIETFVNYHLQDALRVILTKHLTIFDEKLALNAIATCIAIYMIKEKKGEFKNRTIH